MQNPGVHGGGRSHSAGGAIKKTAERLAAALLRRRGQQKSRPPRGGRDQRPGTTVRFLLLLCRANRLAVRVVRASGLVVPGRDAQRARQSRFTVRAQPTGLPGSLYQSLIRVQSGRRVQPQVRFCGEADRHEPAGKGRIGRR